MFTVDGTEDSEMLEVESLPAKDQEGHCLKSEVNRPGFYWEQEMILDFFAIQQGELQIWETKVGDASDWISHLIG